MRLRPRRRNLVVWSSSAVPAGRSVARIRRTRWWLRTGVLLAVLGVLWLTRTARARWEPVCLLTGAALVVTGFALPAVAAFFTGLLILIAALLKGIASSRKDAGQAA